MTSAPALVAETLRCFIGMLLLIASVAKLRTWGRFRANLVDSLGMKAAVAVWLAPAVVMAELVIGAMVLGPAVRAGLWLALALFCLFTIFLFYRFIVQGAVRCGCFGEAQRSLSVLDLLRNMLVIVAAGAGIALQHAPAWSPLALLLAALACALAMRFHEVTVRLLQLAGRHATAPTPLLPGQALPAVRGRGLLRRRAAPPLVPVGQPAVLLFLATGCPKCAGKRRQLAQMLPAAQQAGLDMWIVSSEPAPRLRRFLDGHYPWSHVRRIGRRDYIRLNPLGASPAYLFVDQAVSVAASGMIGDDNWQSLRHQLGLDSAPAGEAA